MEFIWIPLAQNLYNLDDSPGTWRSLIFNFQIVDLFWHASSMQPFKLDVCLHVIVFWVYRKSRHRQCLQMQNKFWISSCANPVSRALGVGCWVGCSGHRVLGLLGFWLSWCNNNVSSSTWMACISNSDFSLDMGEGRIEASDVTLLQALWTSHWLQGHFSPHYKSHCCWPICISTAIGTGSHQPSSWWVALLPDIWLAISHVHHYCWVFGLDALHSPSCAAIIHYLPFLSPKKGSTQIIQLATWKGSGKQQMLRLLTHCDFSLKEGKCCRVFVWALLQCHKGLSLCVLLFAFSNSLENCLF